MEIVAQHMVTDIPQSYSTFLGLCGYFMSKEAVRRCMKEAGMSADDVDVVELHDCFAPNEVCVYWVFAHLSVCLSVCVCRYVCLPITSKTGNMSTATFQMRLFGSPLWPGVASSEPL